MEDLVIRRKRINELGEWEHECVECNEWLPQKRFRGCVGKIDAYGNCLICVSCRCKLATIKRHNTHDNNGREFLTLLGWDIHSTKPIWQQFHDKHNLPYRNI